MFELREESIGDLQGHADIPCAFETHTSYEVSAGASGIELGERVLHSPFRKNYDSAEHPVGWSVALAAVQCIRLSAFAGGDRVGGIVAAVAAPGLVTWEPRADVAVLWDLRVAPAYRRQSVATSLLRTIEQWASRAGCSEFKVETQNTNPAACKFYMRRGFSLLQAHRGMYSKFPDEVQLIWGKPLEG